MLKTEELATLIRFRQELYDGLGLRQDSLFELMDAVLTAAHRSTLVRLSLTATFRRLWSSTCDALADGSVDVTALRTLFTRTLADSAVVDGRPLWVIDGTNWPRPTARASADRTWEYRPLPGLPQSGIVPASACGAGICAASPSSTRSASSSRRSVGLPSALETRQHPIAGAG